MTDNTPSLYDLVNYESGDSWNGTHGRSIHCALTDNGMIEVQSHNDMSVGDVRRVCFTPQQIEEQLKTLSTARYARDFTDAYRSIRQLIASQVPEVAARMATERAAQVATQERVQLIPKIKLKLKPRGL